MDSLRQPGAVDRRTPVFLGHYPGCHRLRHRLPGQGRVRCQVSEITTWVGGAVSSVVVRGRRSCRGVLAVTAGALLAIAGCSTAGSSSSSAAATSAAATSAATPAPSAPAASSAGAAAESAAPAVSMTPLPAAAGQLTGTQLESVLLPESDFPAGFATPSTGPVSSGGSLTTGPASYNLATISCATFIQHFGTTGFGETAMVSGSAADVGQAYDQFIYQFASAPQATAFASGVQALADRCGSFTATANGESGTFSLRAAPGTPVGGHPSVELQQAGTLGGSKLVLDTLLCASGVDVFAASGVGVGGDTPPPQVPNETIVYQLMQRQAAAAGLG